MTFSKTFPRTLKGSTYPIWEEISLSDEEEKEIEGAAKKENIKLLNDCIDEAKKIISERGFKDYQSDVIQLGIALFEKISSHQVYHKENKAKEKFDEKFKESK
ncbi:MAG: hypothetical protein ABIB47_02790 [Candidatus Woesearchaeota archaeon]